MHRRSGSGLAAIICCALAILAPLTAVAQSDTAVQLDAEEITHKTDEELTALTARWNELSASERRALLHEVRARMRASADASARAKANYANKRQSQGVSGVVVQRRYGRKSDGSVVVQTRVIQKRTPATGRVTFGFGFERRANKQSAEQKVQAVSDQPVQEVPSADH